MVEAGKLPGGREKEGNLLALLSFSLSHGLVCEAREAGRKVHKGAQIEAGQNSLCQMRSPAGRGHRAGQAYSQNLAIRNHIQFLQEKGLLGCTKLRTPFCSRPTFIWCRNPSPLMTPLIGGHPQGLRTQSFQTLSSSFLLHVPKPSRMR